MGDYQFRVPIDIKKDHPEMQVSALSDGRLLEQSEIFALNDKYRTQVMSPEVDDLDLFRR